MTEETGQSVAPETDGKAPAAVRDAFDVEANKDFISTLPPDDWDAPRILDEEAPAEEPVAEEAAAEDAAPSEEPAEEEETPEEPKGLSVEERAAAWDKILDAWARDPVSTVEQFAQGLDEQARAEFIRRLTGTQEAPAQEEEFKFTIEPETEFEEVIAKRKDWILKGDTLVEKKIDDAINDFSRNIAPIVDNLWVLAAQNAVLQEAVSALTGNSAEPDIASIIEDVKSGKVADFKSAVKKRYSPVVRKAVATTKQAEKPRPTTPANAGAVSPVIKQGMSMVEIAQLISQGIDTTKS